MLDIAKGILAAAVVALSYFFAAEADAADLSPLRGPVDCYRDQVNAEAGRAVLRPEIWVGMSEQAKARLNRIWLLSVVDSECKPVPVIDGTPAQTVYVPYIDLYESYLRAMDAGNVELVKLLQDSMQVVALTSIEYPLLWAIRPGDLDGSIDGLQRMRKLFRVKEQYARGGIGLGSVPGEHLAHAVMYKMMSGSVIPVCEPHDFPSIGERNHFTDHLSTINAWARTRHDIEYRVEYVNSADVPSGFGLPRKGAQLYAMPTICSSVQQ